MSDKKRIVKRPNGVRRQLSSTIQIDLSRRVQKSVSSIMKVETRNSHLNPSSPVSKNNKSESHPNEEIYVHFNAWNEDEYFTENVRNDRLTLSPGVISPLKGKNSGYDSFLNTSTDVNSVKDINTDTSIDIDEYLIQTPRISSIKQNLTGTSFVQPKYKNRVSDYKSYSGGMRLHLDEPSSAKVESRNNNSIGSQNLTINLTLAKSTSVSFFGSSPNSPTPCLKNMKNEEEMKLKKLNTELEGKMKLIVELQEAIKEADKTSVDLREQLTLLALGTL